MQPVGLEYVVILNDPELRRTVVEQPEERGSAGRQIDLRLNLAHAIRSLVSHVVRREQALDLAGPRQPA
jgi:hypothetical protein